MSDLEKENIELKKANDILEDRLQLFKDLVYRMTEEVEDILYEEDEEDA